MTQLGEAQDAVYNALVTRAANVASPLNVAQGGSSTGQVPISYGNPFTDLQPEHVWVDGGTDVALTPQTTGGTGQPTFLEEFDIRVELWVQQSGDNFQSARTRAEAIVEDIISTISTYTITTTAGLLDSWVIGHVWNATAGTDARGFQITIRLFCRGGPA